VRLQVFKKTLSCGRNGGDKVEASPETSCARSGPPRSTDLPNLHSRKGVRRMDTFGLGSARIGTKKSPRRASTPAPCSAAGRSGGTKDTGGRRARHTGPFSPMQICASTLRPALFEMTGMCHLFAPDAKSIQADSVHAWRVVRRHSARVMYRSAQRPRGSEKGRGARRAATPPFFRNYLQGRPARGVGTAYAYMRNWGREKSRACMPRDRRAGLDSWTNRATDRLGGASRVPSPTAWP